MSGTTPTYAFPYQTLGDAPNGAQGLQDLATAVEAQLVRMDTAVSVHIRTTAGTAAFVKPTSPRARLHWVRIWGGGAAGGGGGASGGSGQGEGAGGGAGGYVEKWYVDSALSASEAYTVGAGGTGGGATGGAGGDTTFKTLTASGGAGGTAMASTAANGTSVGGNGGGAAGGDLNCAGDDGGYGRVLTGQAVLASYGGSCPSGGGRAKPPGAAGAGTAGKSPGGGGSGAFGSTTGVFSGGNGAAGKIEIVSFF